MEETRIRTALDADAEPGTEEWDSGGVIRCCDSTASYAVQMLSWRSCAFVSVCECTGVQPVNAVRVQPVNAMCAAPERNCVKPAWVDALMRSLSESLAGCTRL